MKKRLLALVMAGALTLGLLAGCGNDGGGEDRRRHPPRIPPARPPAEPPLPWSPPAPLRHL